MEIFLGKLDSCEIEDGRREIHPGEHGLIDQATVFRTRIFDNAREFNPGFIHGRLRARESDAVVRDVYNDSVSLFA